MKYFTRKESKIKFFSSQEDSDSITDEEDSTDYKHFLRTSTRLSQQKKEAVSIVWKNLSVIVEHREESIFKKTEISQEQIIHDVTGAIFPANLVAIMGASGSGKTTLMSVLANRNPCSLHCEGDIRINGKPTGAFLKQISGYVYQDDLFIPTLTVMEHLSFAAKLRLDRNLNDRDRKQLITRVLREVGLLKLANTFIGGTSSGKEKMHLSGGERKRLSVATELLTEALILFCDEPTTGLDSFSALQLINMMKDLVCNRNKTIVCSIHQPSKQILECFHQIILLSNGRIVFNGPISDAIKFFEGYGYEYDAEQNSADFLIKSIASIGKNETDGILPIKLHQDFMKSEYSWKIRQYVDNVMKQSDQTDSIDYKLSKIQQLPWVSKLFIITQRNFLSLRRSPAKQTAGWIAPLLFGLLYGLCLWGSVKKTQSGLRAFEATVYIIVSQIFIRPASSGMAFFPDKLPYFCREYSNNCNTPLLFYLSCMIAIIPNCIWDPLAYSLIIYFLAGLQASYFAVIMTSLTVILLHCISFTYGALLPIIFKNQSVAISFGVPILNCLLFCGGFFIKLSSLPFILSWIQYISWFTYACATLYIIQMKDVHNIACDPNFSTPCFRDGIEIIRYFNFDRHSSFYNLGMLLVLLLIMHTLSYVCLRIRIKKRII